MNDLIKIRLKNYFSKYPKKNYSKKEIILEPESKIEYIFFLSKGYIKSYSINENGDELILNILKPGTFFPITSALANLDNRYYFETMTSTTVHIAPLDKVIDFLSNNNHILFDLTKRISSGLEGTLTRIQYLIRSDASKKISAVILLLLKRFGETQKDNSIKITLPLTHQDIANLAGISRETASIEIKKLERDNIVSRNGRSTKILNLLALKKKAVLYAEDNPLPYGF